MQRIFKFAKYLPQFGFTPIVITVDEQKASYPIRDTSLLDDVPAGMQVFRTPSFEPLNILTKLTGNKAPYGGFANKDKEKFTQRLLRFIRGNFFIPDARIGWVKYAYAKAAELIRQEDIATVLISTPPHSAQLVGLQLKKEFPALKWVADLRDPWTGIFYYRDMLHTKRAAAKDAALERQIVETADALIVVSKPIQENYLSKSDKISASKFHVIPNGFDEDDFPPREAAVNEFFTITYTGTIADSYRPEIFFESFAKASQDHPEKKLKLRFVGGRTEQVGALVRKYNLEAITEFIAHVAHEKAIEYMRTSDALLLVIPDVPDSRGILTGKLFEYLASRRPIICVGPKDGDAAAIISECKAGEVFGRDEGPALSSYLAKLFTQSPAAAGNDHVQKYSRKNITKQLTSVL